MIGRIGQDVWLVPCHLTIGIAAIENRRLTPSSQPAMILAAQRLSRKDDIGDADMPKRWCFPPIGLSVTSELPT